MNTLELIKCIKSDLRSKRIFKGVFARDTLPCQKIISRSPSAFVFNTDLARNEGEHWCVIYLDGKGFAEYFDSFGLPPRHKEVIEFIERNSRSYRYNDKHIQNLLSFACGLYVIHYVFMKSRGATMNVALKPFHPLKPWTNDRVVYNLVRHLLCKVKVYYKSSGALVL